MKRSKKNEQDKKEKDMIICDKKFNTKLSQKKKQQRDDNKDVRIKTFLIQLSSFDNN